MKTITTLILILSFTLVGFSQTPNTIFGQELSKTLLDSNNQAYSIVEPNSYEILGIDNGSIVYHNNIVTTDNQGYPMDLDYVYRKLDSNTYEIVAILEEY